MGLDNALWEDISSDITEVLSGDIRLNSQECTRKMRTRVENHDMEELVKVT